jgi:hypothetical protein
MINNRFTYMDALATILVAIALFLLVGCAHNPKQLDISCFPSESSATVLKKPIHSPGPLMVVDGTIIFYDEGGALNRFKLGVCGVR